jgi:outer membrane protein TolC
VQDSLIGFCLDAWRLAHPSDDTVRGRWWEVFGDTRLDTLEAQVSVSNQTVAAALRLLSIETQQQDGTVTSAVRNLQLATTRYTAGVDPYLNVVAARRRCWPISRPRSRSGWIR